MRSPATVPARESVTSAWRREGDPWWLLHNARSALHALWTSARPRRIWLPAYACREVATAVPADIGARYYPVGPQLEPDVGFLAANTPDGDHVLAIDYFGRPARADFVDLVRSRPEIGWVQDCAQSLGDGAGGHAWGDWMLYSPRKLLGVADGGILVGRRKPLPPLRTEPPTDFSFVLPALARFEDRDERDNDRWYAAYRREEAAMRVGLQAMSRLSLAILDACDHRTEWDARRRNALVLHGHLRRWAQFPEPGIGFAPLGYPIRTPSADGLCAQLARLRIFAARHWRDLPSPAGEFAEEHQLARELVTLPCDGRYDEADMQRVAEVVLAALAPRG